MQEYSDNNINELKDKFYSTLFDNSKIGILEQFIYDSEWIKSYIGDDDYLELIGLDFKGKSIIYDLSKIFKKTIGLAEYEQQMMIKKIECAIFDKIQLPNILMEFYSNYCNGFYFFEDLGLGYGLCCQVPSIDGIIYDSWEELNKEQKERIILSFHPNIELDLKRALEWFGSGKIKFIEEYNDYKLPKFIDSRNDEEKKSTVWSTVFEDKEKNISSRKSNIVIKKKPWWKNLTPALT